LGRQRIGGHGRDDEVDLETDEIGREARQAIAAPLCIAVLDADVLPLDPSEVTEPLSECPMPARGIGRRKWRE
jgi:hypothetical protein